MIGRERKENRRTKYRACSEVLYIIESVLAFLPFNHQFHMG